MRFPRPRSLVRRRRLHALLVLAWHGSFAASRSGLLRCQ